jgi:hypothetical protein
MSCGTICCRASFGMINGVRQCQCGAEVELQVDGKVVDLSRFAMSRDKTFAVMAIGLRFGKDGDQPVTYAETDRDFLKECGIAAQHESEED